jgi:hypothetical protein
MSAPSHRGGRPAEKDRGGHDGGSFFYDLDGIRHPVPAGYYVAPLVFNTPLPRVKGRWPRWRSHLNERP